MQVLKSLHTCKLNLPKKIDPTEYWKLENKKQCDKVLCVLWHLWMCMNLDKTVKKISLSWFIYLTAGLNVSSIEVMAGGKADLPCDISTPRSDT